MIDQPVTISGALAAVLSSLIALLAIFWPDKLTPTAVAAIIVFGNSVIILGAAVYSRARTTPVASPTLPSGTLVNVETPKGQADRQVIV